MFAGHEGGDFVLPGICSAKSEMSNYRKEASGQLLRREANKQKGISLVGLIAQFSFTEGHQESPSLSVRSYLALKKQNGLETSITSLKLVVLVL